MPTVGGEVSLLGFPKDTLFVIDTPERRLAIAYMNLAGEVTVVGSAYGINADNETHRSYRPMLGILHENTKVTGYVKPEYSNAKPANIK